MVLSMKRHSLKPRREIIRMSIRSACAWSALREFRVLPRFQTPPRHPRPRAYEAGFSGSGCLTSVPSSWNGAFSERHFPSDFLPCGLRAFATHGFQRVFRPPAACSCGGSRAVFPAPSQNVSSVGYTRGNTRREAAHRKPLVSVLFRMHLRQFRCGIAGKSLPLRRRKVSPKRISCGQGGLAEKESDCLTGYGVRFRS